MSSTDPTEERPAAATPPAEHDDRGPASPGAAERSPLAGEASAPAPRDPALGAAVRAAGIATVVLTVIAALAMGVLWSIGTLLGGLLATVNLVLFIRLGEAFLAQHKRAAPWGVLGAIKLLGLFACVFIIMRQESVSALAFVLGYGALPIAIAVSTLARPKDASSAARR